MRFNRFGLAFDYPENWFVDTQDAADRYATVTVYSPEGGFWSVSGHARGGVSYVITGLAKPLVIAGDAIFAGSMGGGMVSYT